MKKMALVIVACILSSCCKTPQTKDVSHRLNLNISEDPQTLDPRMVSSSRDLSLVMQLFEGLTRMDREGKPQMAVAERMELSSDGCTYTFYLRPSKWSNDEIVTAFDFEYSWKKVLDPNFPSDYAHILFPIYNAKEAKMGQVALSEVGIHALDEKTLQVRLSYPTPYFLELTAFPTFFPVNKNNNAKETFVSNGPFCLNYWKPSEMIEFKKNPLYWEKEKVLLEELVFSVITDNTTEEYLYEKGELDWLGQPLSHNIVTDVLKQLKDGGKLNSYPVAGTYWLKFNTAVEPFNDVRLRKALSYAIDRNQIIDHILYGNQQVATRLLPPSMRRSEELFFQNGDTSQALELFKAYLADHSSPKIVLSYFASERNTKIMQFIADSWRKTFGVDVTLEGMESKVYMQKVKMGEFQVGSGDWIADFNDPISYLELFKRKNDCAWSHANYTALIDEALNEVKSEKRASLLEKAEKILIDEMVVAPLYFYSWDYVKNDSIEGVVLSPLGPVDFKNARKISPSR